jgi:molybdopterin/thiamine biosynthesis adenylyltransferase
MVSRYKHLEKSLGREQMELIQSKTVTIVGLGGVGSACASMLVRSGIGVRIIEKGRVEESDMDRLSLFTQKEIGRFKATEAKKLLTAINEDARVKSFNEEVLKESLFLAEADLILDCSGNDSVTRLLEQYCTEKKIPMIYGQARDTKAIVLTQQGAPCIMSSLQKIPHDNVEGIWPPTFNLAACIMVAKAYRILAGKKIKEEAIVYDIVNHTITHPALRKEPVSAPKAPKKATAKTSAKKK